MPSTAAAVSVTTTRHSRSFVRTTQHRLEDIERRNRIVEANLDWAYGIARNALRRLPPSVNVDDVRILAEHALITAASRFRQDYQGQDYCTPVKFRQYASKAVYGACLMGYRQRNYLEATHGDLDQAENREDPGEHLDDGVKRNQWCVIVRWAIGMLDDRGSKIVEWHHIEGMQLIEVAARIGLTPKWTGVLHARALRQIEALLAMRGIRGVE